MEEQTTEDNKSVLDSGTVVQMPKGIRLTKNRQMILEAAVLELEKTFKQKIWRVFVTQDKYNPDTLHCVNFVFQREMRKGWNA